MVRRVLPGLIVTAVTLGFCVLALEFGLRMMGMGSDTLMRPDPVTGWVHVPGRTGSVLSEDPALGRQLVVKINALGLRDIERSKPKPPGVYRVLFLGDSFVEGQQVPAESTITRQLERVLNAAGEGRFEVWNAGVGGYTTSQELLYLRHETEGFEPDLVILGFLAGNDLADAVPEFATSLRNRPFFRESGDSLVIDRGYFRRDPPGVGWLRQHSRLFTWISTQRQAVRLNLSRRNAAESRDGELPGDLQIYRESPDSAWAAAWRIEDRLILETRDEARSRGADFLLVAFSSGVQETEQAREHWSTWHAWKDRTLLRLDAPERHLAALAEPHGIDFVPLLPEFRDAQARDSQPRHIGWTGHWNSAGHALAARVLAPHILGLLRPATGDSAASAASIARASASSP